MPHYLFAFEYEEVEERAENQANDTAYVSSTGCFIEADDSAAALAWGKAMAEVYFAHLHAGQALSWAGIGYRCWIEEDPGDSDWSHCLAFFPRISVGEHPDPNTLTTEAYLAWAEQESVDIQPSSPAS